MKQFESIFRKSLGRQPATSKTPVTHAIQDIFNSQSQLISSAQARQKDTDDKNAKIASENLKYRSNLQQRIEQEQKKHEKRRAEQLKKIKETEGRRDEYVKEINLKFNNGQKSEFKERAKNCKEYHDAMQQYWAAQQQKIKNSYRSQSAARPLYETSVDNKRTLELRQTDSGLNIRSEMLKRHAGRGHLINRLVYNKQQNVHAVHQQQIQNNLKRHQSMMTTRESKFIASIGSAFAGSGQALQKNRKQLQQKISHKIIDDESYRQTVKSSLQNKFKHRSASLASCRCNKINNIEEEITNSIVLEDKHRANFFTQILKSREKSPTNLTQSRKDFMMRSQSMRSAVSYNKDNLRQKRYNGDNERLERERKISEALALKKSIQVEGNCYVRLSNVK